ncbi:hypothetical protein Q1695_005889 [Nippostrongylus brasiliensis]|nr:hypothetical protein Q1695_005889 [Nippostrongylus brasiliensis]
MTPTRVVVVLLLCGTFLPTSSDATTTASITTTTGTTTTADINGTTTTTPESAGSTVTTETPCQDDPTMDCAKLKLQCKDRRYDDLLDKYCKKTCNRCGLASTTVACFDAVSECEAWKTNGFCNSTLYPDSEKKKYCASTCGLC